MQSVCFVSPLARPILEPEFACDFGGAEVRAANFAKGLAEDPSFDVSMVLRSYRSERPRKVGRLTAHFERRDAPIVRIRDIQRDSHFIWNFLQAKIQSSRRSIAKRLRPKPPAVPYQDPFLMQLPANLLCCFGVHAYSANVVQSASAAGKNSLLFIASDLDLDFEGQNQHITQAYGGDPAVYRYVLQNADQIVVQTPYQRSLLHERFGRQAHLIRNPICLEQRKQRTSKFGDYVLWVGRADTFIKRADKMLKLAAKCPDVPFVAIMNKRDANVFDQLTSDLPPNVKLLSQVPYDDVEKHYANATALLNTSEREGFPNAFLQAAKYGLPVLSLNVDPGEMLSTHGCGHMTEGNLEALSTITSQIWEHRAASMRQTLSDNATQYVIRFHDRRERLEELRHVVCSISDSKQKKAA